MSIYPECTLPLIVSSKVKCKKQKIDGYEHEIWNYDSNVVCLASGLAPELRSSRTWRAT